MTVMDVKGSHRLAITLGTAFASGIATLLTTCVGFRWLLIRYYEWQNGHKNPFTIRADVQAVTLALLVSSLVFSVVLVSLKWRKRSADKQSSKSQGGRNGISLSRGT